MNNLVLDAARSRVRIQTFAEGLLARLAHDLELVCEGLVGSASRTADGASITATATVEAPLRGFAVGGVLGKDGQVDERALSPTERRDIILKMQSDVFHGGADAVVRVEARLEGGAVRVRIVPPNGKPVETVLRPEIRVDGDTMVATGTFEISLAAIGAGVVKGPLGAFRVKDRVRVSFDVAFAPAST